jgi:hypothetical protein
MPVLRRGTRATATSRSGTARGGGPLAGLRPAARDPPVGARSSTSVFHSPQPGHCPCHFGLVAPHWVQLKIVAGRATRGA